MAFSRSVIPAVVPVSLEQTEAVAESLQAFALVASKGGSTSSVAGLALSSGAVNRAAYPQTAKPPEGGFAPTTVDFTGSNSPVQERSRWRLQRRSTVSQW
jgi:hypothetical protein